MANHPGDPFLLTVTVAGAPHSSPVAVTWTADRLTVPAPRHWTQLPAGRSHQVSVLYPPATPDGYALIIDGTTTDTGPELTVSITRAVLHRRGRPVEPNGTECGSDCIPLFPR
ncbi:MAG TPA: hypothetical protein VFX16_09770 [Pseudonocardiaceae bacterium]|nr:hypothetical protein [Pseudonocardiaceae bacterium]